MCLDSIYTAGSTHCIHNPATGENSNSSGGFAGSIEQTLRGRRCRARGAGGRQVLAERGHDVTLFEANTCVGGQVSLAALSPRRAT
jgi:hypothetical protein